MLVWVLEPPASVPRKQAPPRVFKPSFFVLVMLFLLLNSVSAVNSWLCANGMVIPAVGIQGVLDNARLGVIPFKAFYGGNTAMGDTQTLVNKGWTVSYELDMGIYQRGQRGKIRIITDTNHRLLGVVDHELGVFGNGFGLCAELNTPNAPTEVSSMNGSVLSLNDLNSNINPGSMMARFVYQFCLAYLTWQANYNQLPKFMRRRVSRATCPPNRYYDLSPDVVSSPVADDFTTFDLEHNNFIGRLRAQDRDGFNNYYGRCYRVGGEGMECTVARMQFSGQGVYQGKRRAQCSLNTPGNSSPTGGIQLRVRQTGTSPNGDCSSFLSVTVE